MEWGQLLGVVGRAAVGQEAAVYAVAAIGLNIHFGYTGLLNFGQVGFMALGAYGMAIAVTFFGLSLWSGILLSVALSVAFAFLLGSPTLRLRADYLAIVTIAAGEIVRLVARSASLREVTGGSSGLGAFADEFYAINPLPPGSYGGFDERRLWFLLVAWILVGLSAALCYRMMHSPWGRVVKSIREDEDAARSLGKNVFSYKMQALVIGGLFGTLGGMLLAVSTQSVQPDSYSTPVTFFAYTVLILGGTARVFGPVFGSMIFWALLAAVDAGLREAITAGIIPSTVLDPNEIGILRLALVGLGLMMLMIFRPQGLFGDRKELMLDG